jgi:N-methylhydantoinase B
MTNGTASDEVEIVWDGRIHSYRPAADWRSRLSPKLELHTEESDLDPVTYEVIRHRLWTINLSHGQTITRISGSPILASFDFNMTLLTEDGDVVMNAPYVQYLNSGAPLVVKYIMERFADNPGICDGDIFVGNDPWIGASHQMDVFMACPIFVDGKLFAWVSNAGHQYDLGGIAPGGFPPDAVDVFSDPVVLPPVKVMKEGTICEDVMDLVLRQSRMRDLVALDLRAQMSGCLFARNAILTACEEFGHGVVKAGMRRIVTNAQEAFRERLLRIPDGTWSQVRYLDEKLPGDRGSYRIQVNLTKTGDRLRVDNQGTAPQLEGPLGFPFVGFAGSTLGPIAVTMLYDQLFAIGGAERQIDYDPQPGLLTCIDYPAATSFGVCSIVTYLAAVQVCLCRMLSVDDELAEGINAPSGEYPVPLVFGTKEDGQFYGQPMLDILGVGMGARAHSDGVNTSGPTWSPLAYLLDAETVEQWYPLIYLHRREMADTAGAGKWRGGSGLAFAWMPYRAGSMTVGTFSMGASVSTHGAPGLFGGYPSPTGHVVISAGTDINEWFARGRMPHDLADLQANSRTALRGKSTGVALEAGDIAECRIPGGGGYGDPLERAPERVAADVSAGYVSSGAAHEIYGVVADELGRLDREATEVLRERQLEQRRGWTPADAPAGERRAPESPHGEKVHEYLVCVKTGDGAEVLSCSRCGHHVCARTADFKQGLLIHEGSVTQIPGVADPSEMIDADMVLRRYCCPSCGVLMATDVVEREEPTLTEMRLAAR